MVLLISGGVDSCVVAALLLKSLDPERVHLMYFDTGLMRQNESEEVLQSLGGWAPATSTTSMPPIGSTPALPGWQTPSRSGGSSATCS